MDPSLDALAFRPEDDAPAPEIKRLEDRSQAEACARLMASSEPWRTLGRDYETSLRVINDSTREVYVATVGQDLVGFLILCLTGAFVGYLQTIAVAPSWRGRGIGQTLIAFSEDRIFRDHPNVFMCVSSFNHDARRLYQRLGYEEIGELKDFIIRGYSEILLRKTRGPLVR